MNNMEQELMGAARQPNRRPKGGAAILWAVLAAAMILIGSACGGGGGGGSSTNASATATSAATSTATATNTTTTGTLTAIHIVGSAINNSSQAVDPDDTVAGQPVQLQVVALNSGGNWATYSGSNWSTTAPASVATVSSTGLLSPVSSSNGASYTVSCTGPAGVVSAALAVEPNSQPYVSGLVRDKAGLGISQVYVDFYSSGGLQVGEAITGTNGKFIASVPASATGFTVNIGIADPTSYFYRQFEYGASGKTFDYLEEASCPAPLPKLVAGVNSLASDIVLDDVGSGPPPPPTGCNQG